MPLYAYKGRNRQGEAMLGRMEADDQDAVAVELFKIGITPIEIEIARDEDEVQDKASSRLVMGLQRVSLDELTILSQQMYTLMRTGVPLLKGLSGLIQTTHNPVLKARLQDVMNDLQAGVDFGTALAKHPKVFSPLFVSIVRVGEQTGNLDQAFLQLSSYLELERNTREQISQALRYPMIVFAVIAIALVVINLKVLPEFSAAFEKFGADLPMFTVILMDISKFTVNWWMEMGIALVASLFGLKYWLATEEGDYIWSKWKLRIPVVGDIVLKATLGRFCRSLAMSIKAGVPVVQSLTSIASVVDNSFISASIYNMRDAIERGESITRTATATGLFTPLVLQMIAIGEETGALDELLNETAGHYEREVSYNVKRLSDLIEPVIIVLIGIIVLILALGIFLPMWELSSAMRR